MKRPVAETLSDNAHIIVASIGLVILGGLIAAIANQGLVAFAQFTASKGVHL